MIPRFTTLVLVALLAPGCLASYEDREVSQRAASLAAGADGGAGDDGGYTDVDGGGVCSPDAGCSPSSCFIPSSPVSPQSSHQGAAASAALVQRIPASAVIADGGTRADGGIRADGGSGGFDINDPFHGFNPGPYVLGSNDCGPMSCKYCQFYGKANPGKQCYIVGVGTTTPGVTGHAFNLVDTGTQWCLIDYLNPGQKLCVPKTKPPSTFAVQDICAMYPPDWCVKKPDGSCYTDKNGDPIGNPACQDPNAQFVRLACKNNKLACNNGSPITRPIPVLR